MTGYLRHILIIAVLGGGLYFASGYFVTSNCCEEGISELYIHEPATPPTNYMLRILFIGNSYTFFNNLPRMIGEIAHSDPQNHIRFEIKSITKGGIGLKELWDAGDALKILRSERWDYVVLQEQSFWAMSPESISDTNKSVKAFQQQILQQGARSVFFISWPRKAGSHWYTDGQTNFLRSPEYMQQRFNYYSQRIAEPIGAQTIGVGDYWLYMQQAYPEMELYRTDGTHPSPAGTYLSALLFYRYFTGFKPDQSSYIPSGVNQKDAAILRSVISQ